MLTILMYHQIAQVPPDRDPFKLAITPESFERQMRYLQQAGYECIRVGDAVRSLHEGKKPHRKALALTFDDGFRDVYTTVRPILRQFGYTATIFPVAGRIGCDSDWEGQTGDLAVPLLSWAQIEALVSEGFEVGSHTMTHPRLSQLSREQIEYEVRQPRQVLQDRLGIQVDLFSYPFSNQNPDIQRIVAANGYLAACSGERGAWNLFNLWRAQCNRDEHLTSFVLKAGGWYHRRIWLREETAIGPPLRSVIGSARRLAHNRRGRTASGRSRHSLDVPEG